MIVVICIVKNFTHTSISPQWNQNIYFTMISQYQFKLLFKCLLTRNKCVKFFTIHITTIISYIAQIYNCKIYSKKTQNKSRTSQLFTFAYSWITAVWLQTINFLYKEYDSSYMYCKEFYTFVSGLFSQKWLELQVPV
jgi:hypothetical protein